MQKRLQGVRTALMDLMTKMLNVMLNQTMKEKVRKLVKDKKPVTKENLMTKWEVLQEKAGCSYEMVSEAADKAIEDYNARCH